MEPRAISHVSNSTQGCELASPCVAFVHAAAVHSDISRLIGNTPNPLWEESESTSDCCMMQYPKDEPHT